MHAHTNMNNCTSLRAHTYVNTYTCTHSTHTSAWENCFYLRTIRWDIKKEEKRRGIRRNKICQFDSLKFLKYLFFYLCGCWAYVHICAPHARLVSVEVRREHWDLLELVLQMVMSQHVCVRNKPVSPWRAASVFNFWAISPVSLV